ncbi:phosphate/phosphite/phosphonate ABC transporter substrate-binding protein [Protaetiibacter larvae]|uniref:Phosphate/phosphite/phosphonate ABC transporter substrate-binding protein n=1 Tax=Protaetiibacter larvae TaxID=2592654 RepID=A0A5C1Y6S4_9MICO|nr:phosphate/phosphite/phosphonate ABC transporter substrate-binding protein [Protaetiibacter larvae]QEO09138.1 phosphate/phosphite/phosphonate ABC transporter substrate-binding protein [Protaetiibacter larvae]
MRIRSRLLGVGAGVALAALALTGCSTDPAPADGGKAAPAADEGTFAKDADTLVFVVLPDHEGSDQDAEPIADYIAEITGKKVEFFEATDYTAAIQALASGQADIGQISAFTYYQSKNAGADISPIGAQITKEGAEPGYYSVAIKNPASSASSLADFADQPVCFVNPESTSGFLIPNSQLLKAGVTVPEDKQVFGEKHPATAALVAEGAQCQVGFAQDIDADPLIASGQLEEVDRYLVPAAPIVLQNALPQDVKDALFAGLQGSTQKSLTDKGIELNDFLLNGWFGFGAVDDAYYDTITAVCEQLPDVEACKA